MTLQEQEAAIRTRLSETGVRLTHGRRALVRALLAADGPQTAAELHRRLKSAVPLSSLYRSLALFAEAGVAVEHRGQGRIARYELAEWLTGHHHHAVCLQCGEIGDIQLAPTDEELLEELAARTSRTTGYLVRGHSLEVEGLCRRCQ
jgi:Fur family ferric uptake transcriptional regulator